MNAQPILDVDTIEMLKEIMAEDFQLLLTTFLRDAPQRLAELKTLLSANDIEGLERPAHTLKGSSGNIGAKSLSSACSVLVNQIRAKSVTDPHGSVKRIIGEYEKVEPLIQAYQNPK